MGRRLSKFKRSKILVPWTFLRWEQKLMCMNWTGTYFERNLKWTSRSMRKQITCDPSSYCSFNKGAMRIEMNNSVLKLDPPSVFVRFNSSVPTVSNLKKTANLLQGEWKYIECCLGNRSVLTCLTFQPCEDMERIEIQTLKLSGGSKITKFIMHIRKRAKPIQKTKFENEIKFQQSGCLFRYVYCLIALTSLGWN